jgi:hypothetical protein
MRKNDLSRPQKWLIERCQIVRFGKLRFHVRVGAPDLSLPCQVSRTIRLFGGDNGPRPESSITDFVLCKEQLALLKQLSTLLDGTCVSVKVMNGLPSSSIDIEEEQRAA